MLQISLIVSHLLLQVFKLKRSLHPFTSTTTMKLSATFFLLPILASASPITSPDPTVLPRDNACKIINAEANCYSKPSSDAAFIRQISSAHEFGVSCVAKNSIGYKWDYIPGWGCWVAFSETRAACEGMSLCCDFVRRLEY